MDEAVRQREFEERFGAAIETWRFHVQSYWNRTTYFAFFQIGSFSGLWGIFTGHKHLYSAAFFSLLGALLSVIWFINSHRMQEHLSYWWNRAAAIEKDFDISPARSLIQHHDATRGSTRRRGRYSSWMQAVPCVFLAGWIWMLVWSLATIGAALHHAL